MKSLFSAICILLPLSASAITPLTDQEYEQLVKTFKIMPSGACEASEDGFDVFLEYFTRNPQLAAQYTQSTASTPFYLGLRDYTWVYGSPDNDFENPDAVLTHTFTKGQPNKVNITVQPGEYDSEYNIVRKWGDLKSYNFTFTQGCWKRVK